MKIRQIVIGVLIALGLVAAAAGTAAVSASAAGAKPLVYMHSLQLKPFVYMHS